MSGTIDLKFLATKALERLDRNKARNRTGTNDENLVPQLMGDGTRNNVDNLDISDKQYAYEERIAIMEYDGGLEGDKVVGITTLDLFKDLLWTNEI